MINFLLFAVCTLNVNLWLSLWHVLYCLQRVELYKYVLCAHQAATLLIVMLE